MADEQTTGTTDQEGGDAVEQSPTAGTPETEQSRDAGSEGKDTTDWKEIALAYKEKAEKYNKLVKEQDDAEPQPPDAAGAVSDDGFETWVQKGDPVARRLALLERKMYLDEQLNAMPADERSGVIAHFRKNHMRLGDMNAARAEVNAAKYESELERLRRENETLKRGPDPEVLNAPPTGGREVTARERSQRNITEAQFDSEYSRVMSSQGELAAMSWATKNADRIKG